ncbi:MAG TPA: DUF4386 domain-containing protein [Candidatus Acidoferrum sp.]|nr:DUF4386 domain-containing protein [Candidatus Acidoferrum sp.]
MTSNKKKARIAGLLYFVTSIFGFFGLAYVPSVIFVAGDPAATAKNIQAHELLLRGGIVSNLIASIGFIFVALALYELLKGVHQKLAASMVILIGASIPVSLMNEVNRLATLKLLTGAGFSSAFQKPQLDAMALLFHGLWNQGNLVAQILWGLWLIPFGILVYKSGFLPRILGVLLFIACLGYLTSSFTLLLFPAYGPSVTTYSTLLNFCELPIILWLLIMGAKDQPANAIA